MAAGKDTEERRVDSNRARRLEAVRALETLFAVLCDPSFRGHISIRINGKDGVAGGPIRIIEEHPRA